MKLPIAFLLVISSALKYTFANERDITNDGPRQLGNFSVEVNNSEDNEPLFTNTWAVHIEDGVEKAEELAGKHGFHFHGQLGGLKDHYLFEHKNIDTRSRRSIEHHTLLSKDESVRWAEQQQIIIRTKRDEFKDFTDPLFKDQWYLKNRGK